MASADEAPQRENVAEVQRALEILTRAEDGQHRDVAAAAGRALAELEAAAEWKRELLSDRIVEEVAGALFALDAQEPIRDAQGGWRKDRLRDAARSLLDAAVEAVDTPPRA
jgi:hypothetical protein